MAKKRMFSLQIVDTDAFLDMPLSTQALYFHLSMRADDDGFVSNPKKIMRILGVQEDEIKVLFTKKFILGFENGIIVIKHWKIHNYIQKDRYNPTAYTKQKSLLSEKENGGYTLDTECIQDVSTDKIRLDKIRLDKISIVETVDNFLSTKLRDLIKSNTPTFKEPNIDKWAIHISRMRRIDKRTPEQIEFLIKWCQQDTFWQANILSTKKLREKFDVLVAQVKRTRDKNNITII
jgi:hypothetical protein